MSVTGWLLEGDPAIRWQVLRDLTDAPAGDVAAERARVEHDGWGRASSRSKTLTASGPAARASRRPTAALSRGSPWTATMHTLQTLRLQWWDATA